MRANVKRGATLISDGHASYPGLSGDYRHDPRVVGKMAAHIVLPWSHRAFSLLKRWALGTYHGPRRKHVDTYLDEFVFRYNRRFYRHVSFETVLGLAAHHEPASYWDIIKRDNPRKGRQTLEPTSALPPSMPAPSPGSFRTGRRGRFRPHRAGRRQPQARRAEHRHGARRPPDPAQAARPPQQLCQARRVSRARRPVRRTPAQRRAVNDPAWSGITVRLGRSSRRMLQAKNPLSRTGEFAERYE